MSGDTVLRIGIADPELLHATVREYNEQLEAATDHCYECDGEDFCAKHAPLAEQLSDDLSALVVGMVTMELLGKE